MTPAVMQTLEFLITVGGVFALFIGLVAAMLWIWNH